MAGNPIIRDARREDFDDWLPLWNGYNAFYGREGATALDPSITSMTWTRFFDHYEPIHCLVAEHDGRVLGLAHYLFHRSTIAIQPNCYMQDLFTHPKARGLGLGRALIDTVYKRAEQAGCPRVYWHTYETNTTARALYDKVAQYAGAIVYSKTLA